MGKRKLGKRKMFNVGRIVSFNKKRIDEWVKNHYLQIGIFNVFIILLFLLHSVGYFYPLFGLNVRIIVFSGLIFSALFLGATSSTFFVVSLIFWMIVMFFKLLKIDIWAERTAIYTFYSLVLGILQFLLRGNK